MPVYKYKVRDKFGKPITGSIGGDNKDTVALHFESMGYTPVSIEEESQAPQVTLLRGFRRVGLEDMVLFNRQLVTLIRAGLPLLGSLNAVGRQTKSRYLKDAVTIITKDIEGGRSFSEALKRHPRIFDELYINTIKAGEASGALDEVLARLADLIEHEADTRAKIKSATRYPIIAMTVLSFGFFILITYVVPRFITIFDKFKMTLPLPTRILIWINYAIMNYWYVALILTIGLVLGFRKFISTGYGERLWDNLKLKVPIFGPLFLLLTMSRFSRIMSIMIRSGVPILGVLEIVSRASGNVVIEEAIKDIINSVNQGKGMAAPMALSKVFTPIVVQMVAIGEETGKVDELLLRVSEYYDQQADYMIKNLTTMLEPLLVVLLGCVVLFLALAIFLPMWNMAGLFRR